MFELHESIMSNVPRVPCVGRRKTRGEGGSVEETEQSKGSETEKTFKGFTRFEFKRTLDPRLLRITRTFYFIPLSTARISLSFTTVTQ